MEVVVGFCIALMLLGFLRVLDELARQRSQRCGIGGPRRGGRN